MQGSNSDHNHKHYYDNPADYHKHHNHNTGYYHNYKHHYHNRATPDNYHFYAPAIYDYDDIAPGYHYD